MVCRIMVVVPREWAVSASHDPHPHVPDDLRDLLNQAEKRHPGVALLAYIDGTPDELDETGNPDLTFRILPSGTIGTASTAFWSASALEAASRYLDQWFPVVQDLARTYKSTLDARSNG